MKTDNTTYEAITKSLIESSNALESRLETSVKGYLDVVGTIQSHLKVHSKELAEIQVILERCKNTV